MDVFLDDRYAFSLSPEVGVSLYVSQALDRASIEQLLARDNASRAYEAALRFLAFRPRSVAEVRRRLAARDIPAGAIDAALDRLARSGLIGDEAFATFWVEQRQTFRPRAPRALLAELRLKGVDSETARAAVATVAYSEEDAAYRAGLRRAQRLSAADRQRFAGVLAGHLGRRGFGSSSIRGATQRLWAEVTGAGPTGRGEEPSPRGPSSL